MKILSLGIFRGKEGEQDEVVVEGTHGTYVINTEKLAKWLDEDGQYCSRCDDTQEVSTDESDGEGHIQEGVGTQRCPDCAVPDDLDDETGDF